MKYALIHEYGGVTRPHRIVARNAKALAFSFQGRLTFRRSVNHPGSNIPARRPLQRTIEERLPNYERALSNAIVDAWNRITAGQSGGLA